MRLAGKTDHSQAKGAKSRPGPYSSKVHPWGLLRSRDGLVWPGDLGVVTGLGRCLVRALPDGCAVAAAALAGVQLERPQPLGGEDERAGCRAAAADSRGRRAAQRIPGKGSGSGAHEAGRAHRPQRRRRLLARRRRSRHRRPRHHRRRPPPARTTAALLSDGAARAVDPFGLGDWQDVLTILAAAGPGELIRQVRAAETADPAGLRWPRNKIHDDAAAILIQQ